MSHVEPWPTIEHGAEPAESFELEIRRDGERVIVIPYGDLELATADRVSEAIDGLVATGLVDIVLDLSSLWFMDSTGLSLVIRHSHRDDIDLRVIDGGAYVTRVFDVAGVRAAIPFISAHDLEAEPLADRSADGATSSASSRRSA